MSSVVETNTVTSAPQVVDVEAMLTAIPGDNPAGESQQYTGLYDEIREARRADDNLGQGDWVRETKTADWVKVATLTTDAIINQTKDLQICAWMAEALTKLYGVAGLRDALKVMHGLHENFWDNLYPEEDEGDLEARANAISWMEREAAAAIKQAPITKGAGLSFIDYEDSNTLNVGPEVDPDVAQERRTRAAEEGKATSEDWVKEKNASPRAFYETLYATFNECWENFHALDRSIDAHYGNQAPAMMDLKKNLDAVRTVVERIVKEKRLLEPDAISDDAGGATADGDGGALAGSNGGYGAVASATGGVSVVSGPIRTRADAVKRLTEVAAFFRQTEPHSPVSYLVERAVRWSQMPLESWLASVIKDEAVLTSVRETLGVDVGSSYTSSSSAEE